MLAWILKRFLFHWIKRKFGIRMTLLLLPVVLLLLTIPASILGEGYGYGGGMQMFAYFFLLVVLSNLFSRSMKESMEHPSMNLIYQSLNTRERENIQSGIEGVFTQIGVFTAGLFLSLFIMFQFIELHHVSYVLFLLLLIWLVVGLSLYKSYHRLLKVTLESDRVFDPSDLRLEEIEQFDIEQSSFSLELIEFNPYFFHYVSRERELSLLAHSDPKVRRIIWDHILKSSPGLSDMTISQMLVNERVPDIKERIRQLKKAPAEIKTGIAGGLYPRTT